jgi:putative SOS response-associated peptidase YedK
MCGRYAITSTPEAIRRVFGYAEQPNFPSRYNVAPTQPVPLVRLAEGKRQFALVRWGLIPSWVKDPRTFPLLINARGESVLDKPAFRNAMKRRRCLFVTDGFYEWKEESGRKRVFFIHKKSGGPMALAGIWETWTGPNGEELESAAIVTTRANRTCAAIHDRMPVILDPAAYDMWLDCASVDAETAAALIAPAPDDLLEVYEVSPAVNRTANDSPMLIVPASERPADAAHETRADKKPTAKPRRKKKAEDTGQASLF